MYYKEKNKITKEIIAFGGHGWKNWDDNAPMVTLHSNDGYGNHTGQSMTVEEAVELIDLLETLIAQAKETEDNDPHKWDDVPF